MGPDQRFRQPTQDELAELEADFAKYGNLPKVLLKYVLEAIRKQKMKDRFLRELFSQARHTLLAELDGRLGRESAKSSLEPDSLVRAMDFQPRDVAEGRFEAFIAELRAMAGLYWFGMKQVRPLKAGKLRGADFVAMNQSHRYAVEVFHKELTPGSDIYEFQDMYTSIAAEKKGQAERTARDHNCDKKALACVLDGHYFALSTRTKIISQLRDVFERLNWGDSWHFCAITGMVSIDGEPDDSVYPDFD